MKKHVILEKVHPILENEELKFQSDCCVSGLERSNPSYREQVVRGLDGRISSFLRYLGIVENYY